jgi:transposase
MSKKVYYSPEVKWKAVEMKLSGKTNAEIMEALNIKNRSQIKIWMKWYRNGETHRFNQPIGKQYSYNKGIEELSELEKLKIENRQLKAKLEIMGKYLEIERR